MMLPFSAVILFIAPYAKAHLAFFHPGMYAFNGTGGFDNPNNGDPVGPLYMLSKDNGYWFHSWNHVDKFPPPDGTYLELPAGGSFTGEIAGNKGQTSYSYGGKYTSAWGDGQQHPDDYSAYPNCIGSPNMHCKNETDAAGTAFAISYQSDITKVTLENLVVFTVRKNTPYRRVVTYDVPMLPPCPEDGCICAWVWVPNHCGSPNMYMIPYKCKVTGTPGVHPVKLPAVAPVWCEDDPSKCVKGPKQIVVYNQLEGNNVVLTGWQKDGDEKSPGYNMKMGFHDGAQTDIFDDTITLTPGGNTGGNTTTTTTTPGGRTTTPGVTPTNGIKLANDTNPSPSPAPSSNPSLPPTPSSYPSRTKSGGNCHQSTHAHKRKRLNFHH